MDSEASTRHVDVLERIVLDESAKPTTLPLSLLKYITNCFSSDHEIGSGGFAVVYKGVVGKGMVAVKKLSNTFGIHENKFQEEVKCLIKARHKNIVRFLGYCADTQGKLEDYNGSVVMADERNMLLCFEYVCNGSLDKHITGASDGLNWRQRYQIIRGICEGLLFLHDERIIHLDLKPANILLDGYMVPKIADFCLSRILSQVQNIYGTLGYMDPEYIRSGHITFASDIYSLGVIIIEIMTGARQYFEDGHVVESWRIRLEALEGDMQLEQVRVCYKIAIDCMDLDPKKRPVARHIVIRLDKTASVVYSGKTTIGTHQVNVLERLLFDESAEPTNLPLSLLQDITNHFSLDHQIGCGSFAVVYKGVVGKGMVAVKKLSNTFGIHEKKFQDEIKCLIKAKHKNIVRFLGYCADAQGKMKAYEGDLVMAEDRNWLLCFDYVCNGSLDKHITDVTCGLNWRIWYQIIRGVSKGLVFLREKEILHLDLKPANILLDGHMIPKIADFGISRCLDQAQTSTITENIFGTKGYMDPESIRSGQIGYASDVYSLGVIIMEILTGKRQYRKDENAVERWMSRLGVSEGDMQLKQVRVCSEIAIECMDLDPAKRPDACHIIDRLDKIEGTDKSDETGINNSLIELQGSLPREQSEERVGKLAGAGLQKEYMEEQLEILEDVASNLGRLHFQEGQQGEQDTMQQVNCHGASNSSSISTGFNELNILDIYIRTAHKIFDRNNRRTSEQTHFINIFRMQKLRPIIRSENLIGEGFFTKVYKGVVDNVLVAVEQPFDVDNKDLGDEVIIQSQISHKNIAWLIGCCLEIDNPILVYEFLPRGSLHDILHRDSKVPLSLDVRLNIAAESAQGLAYLHSQARTKILHGNVKPESILLDENFMPKIAGFGLSKLIAGDKGHTGNIIGDMTYMDPVHLQTGLLTLKSDVYSFGIVILELISRKKATHSDNNSLVWSFHDVHKEGKKAAQLFDEEIAVTTGDLEVLDRLTEIAMECLNLDVDQRPTMTEVAERLLILNRAHRLHAQHTSADLPWGLQDTNRHGRGNSSSISTGFFKLNNLDIFNWKGRRNFNRKTRHTLEKSHFIKIFRKEELKPIIRSANSIGRGAFGEVYKGFVDNTLVAVKIPIGSNVLEIQQFRNEVINMSQVSHKNIVRLIGCCREVDHPMLVFELVSNGTLNDILHGGNNAPLKLDVRLAIVAEAAQGLAYLHSQGRIKIMHGDVKPKSILLDENFMPKIAGFGLSRFITGDKEHTLNVICNNYTDPVYVQTGLLTLKSDVYSFGIVILEVISRKEATQSDNNSLVRSFLEVHKEGKKATELFDKEIAVTTEDLELLDCLAAIAVECLNLDVDQRPTMTDVAERLLMLNRSRRSQAV